MASGWWPVWELSCGVSEQGRVKSYKDLLAWQKGIQLVKQVYLLTKDFPVDEKFGLVSQMLRAGVSVPSNIAGNQSRPDGGLEV